MPSGPVGNLQGRKGSGMGFRDWLPLEHAMTPWCHPDGRGYWGRVSKMRGSDRLRQGLGSPICSMIPGTQIVNFPAERYMR